MPTIFRKELHEVLLPTVILVPLSLAMLISGMEVGNTRDITGSVLSIGNLPLTSWPLWVGVIALIIGFRQGRSEVTVDQIAMQMHRPWPRSHLSAAKLHAGWLALVAAVALPLAISAVWQDGFGAVPISAAQLLLPGLTLITMVSCHAAGIYAGLTSGPWYGLRSVPALIALLSCEMSCHGYAMSVITLADLLLRYGAGAAICVLSITLAWKSLQAHGDESRVGTVARQIPIAMLCCSFGLGLIAIAGGCSHWLTRQSVYQGYAFGTNGGVCLQRSVITGSTLRDVSRLPLDASQSADRAIAGKSLHDDDDSWEFKVMDGRYRRPDPRFGPRIDLATPIFQLRATEGPYAGLLIGGNGQSGAIRVHARPGQDPYVIDQTGVPLPSRATIFQVASLPRATIGKETTCLLMADSDGRPWWWMSDATYPIHVDGPWTAGIPINMSISIDGPTSPPRITVITEDGLRQYSVDGSDVDAQLVPGGLTGTASGSFSRRPDGTWLILSHATFDVQSASAFRHVDATGQPLSSRMVPDLPTVQTLRSAWFPICAGLVPLASLPFITVDGHWYFNSTPFDSRPSWWPSVIAAVAATLAVPVIGRRRRLTRSDRGWWLLWCPLFGIAGLAAMLLLARPKPAARCATCQGWHPIALEACPHCGASWDTSVDPGLSILEPAA